MKRLYNSGDTIVEVLIAIAVVSLILGAAFASASRSLNTTRQAQEHGEATKLVEGQMERLKSQGADVASTVYTALPPFCVNNANVVVGAPCNNSILGVTYSLSIDRSGDTFSVSAVWDKVAGEGQDNVTIIYKMYKPTP